jgi:hypothetical protein
MQGSFLGYEEYLRLLESEGVFDLLSEWCDLDV